MGDSIEYLMRYTALGAPGFGVVTVAGALIGGMLGALSMGRLRLTTFADKSDSVRNMFGAALMGIGILCPDSRPPILPNEVAGDDVGVGGVSRSEDAIEPTSRGVDEQWFG